MTLSTNCPNAENFLAKSRIIVASAEFFALLYHVTAGKTFNDSENPQKIFQDVINLPVLDWLGKEKVINHHLDVPFRFLDKKFSVGNSHNKIICGDNLLALKSLLPEFAGRIKCIYIDPPYNTGNENWIYNDNVNDAQIKRWLGQVVGKEGEDLTRHDKWLCMMYPRLRLLQKLLSVDGAIFISIDDNEQANLKLICDEIFGANNFVASIPWQSRQSLQNDTDLSINHEFIVVYAKKRRMKNRRLKPSNADRWHAIKEFAFNPLPIDESKFDNPDNDPRGAWKADPFDAPNIRPNLTYPITNPNTGEVFLPPDGRHWRVAPEKFSILLADGRIIFGKTGKTKPQLKVFLSEQQGLGSVPNSWFDAESCGTATEGTKLLQKIFGDKNIFDTPKPTRLLEKILRLATDKDSIVLDAFAGSGTTAHALINLNKSDGGNRKFILVELNDYAETITAERVKRIGGEFDFYELGATLFDDEGFINSSVTREQLFDYVYFMATHKHYEPTDEENLLGVDDETAYYFFGGEELNFNLLAKIRTLAVAYVIYAATCTLADSELDEFHITFKKVPIDIPRL